MFGAYKSCAPSCPVTKFFTMTPNTCGFLVQNLLHVTLLASRMLRWLLIFGKFVYPGLGAVNFYQETSTIMYDTYSHTQLSTQIRSLHTSLALAFSFACSGSSDFDLLLAARSNNSLSCSSCRFLSTRSNSSRNLS